MIRDDDRPWFRDSREAFGDAPMSPMFSGSDILGTKK